MNTTVNTKLNQDLHPLLSSENQVSYALNCDVSGHDSNEQLGFIQNTLSNKLCYTFVGEDMGNIPLDGNDVVIFEGRGDDSKILLLNTETCLYKIIAQDKCLNFQDKIKGRYRRGEDGRTIYFGNKNRLNYLNIDCPPKKRKNDCQDCLDEYEACLDCGALNINKHINIPCITLTETSGNIPNGSYQIAIAFSSFGSTQTEYFILPDVIKIFDKNNRTSGIGIEFNECFTTFYDEFELILIANRDSGQTYQRVTHLNTSQKSYNITELDSPNYVPIDSQVLFRRSPYYQGFEFIAENSESLILGEPCTRKTFDYRPLANQIVIEPVIISVKKENAHLYPSLLRDEVYPFDISWVHPDGQESHRTHIPNLVDNGIVIDGTSYLMTDVAPNNLDHYELATTDCNVVTKKVFELYNNGTITFNTDSCIDCDEIEVGSGTMSYWESGENYPDTYPDLGCTPIKYHKMPDDCITPIVTDGCINILTVRLTNVNPPLDCDGNVIPTLGYKVHVGDRTNHKSILSKGLIYNMGIHDVGCENILFPNFPFNDLDNNNFLSDQWERGILTTKNQLNTYSDNQFTYHSPDIHYVKGAQGDSLKIYTEAIGKTQGVYHYTNNYPKYQILSSFGNLIAQIAGFVEATIALNGEDCETTIVEKECNKKVERQTTVTGQQQVSSVATNFTGLVTVAAPMGAGTHDWSLVSNTGTPTYQNAPDITETENGDAPCGDVFAVDVGSVEFLEGFQDTIPVIADIVNPYGEGGKCYITGSTLNTVTNPAVPDGTGITYCYTEGTSSGSSQRCISGIVSNGTFKLEIPTDCDDLPTPTSADFIFDPECPCTGDTKTTTIKEQKNCDTKIDFINKLPDLSRLPASLYYYMQGQSAVNDFLQSLLKPTNYAVQYTAEAEYDNHVCNNIYGNKRRHIDNQVYLDPIKQRIEGEYINNWCRESSDYLKLGADLTRPVNRDFTSLLHSQIGCDGTSSCENNVQFPYGSSYGGTTIQAVSYYTGITRYVPNQYGQLTDYNTKVAGCLQTGTISDVIYAGDVFITKMSVKRKMPLFTKLPLDLPNNIEWDMRDYPNLAFPTYWLNYSKESVIEDIMEITLPNFGGKLKDYSFDRVEGLGQCFNSVQEAIITFGELLGGAFNPSAAVIVSILGLTGGNYINPIKQTGIFYTHVTGVANFWCESEFQSSYRECNDLNQSNFYPIIDLEDSADSSEYHLPEQFLYNLQYNWNGLTKQTSTISQESKYCKENNLNILAYSNKTNEESIADEWLNFPPLSYQKFTNSDGRMTAIQQIDDYNLFIGFEDAAYVTQQDEGLLTDSGGDVYIGSPNAFQRRLKKISTDSTGYGGTIDPDAVIMSRFGLIYPDRKRKKWLLYNGQLNDITGSFASWFQEYMNKPIRGVWDNFTENYYYSTDDWTISYKPMLQDWISYHSWIPTTYISTPNTFLTSNAKGIWRHNEKYSYQMYYGDIHRFEVGIYVKTQGNQKLQSIQVFSEFYENRGYDVKIYHRDKFFDEIIVHNNCSSTNIQSLQIQDNNKLSIKTPTASLVNCDEWRINQLYDYHSKQPITRRLDNGWEYEDTPDTIRDRSLDGRWFKIHLRSNKFTNLKKMVEITLTKLDTNNV